MIAGITGHQKIGTPQTINWVREQLLRLLVAESVTEGWTSLAMGADQLFASLLSQQGLPYNVVLPCRQYEATFSESDRHIFFSFLSKASSVVTLNFDKPSEVAYLDAGKEVVSRSETLIAVWDGLPAKGLGGTADVVHFARERLKRVLHVDTSTHVVSLI